LHILSESHLLDGWALREYVLTCQSPYGGFGKVVGAMVNPYFSLLFSCPSLDMHKLTLIASLTAGSIAFLLLISLVVVECRARLL